MFELLAEIFASCWRLLRAELPDCALILDEVRSGRRTIPPASKGYLWLCNITSASAVLRGVAVVWFFLAAIDLLVHFRIKWPPFAFEDTHDLWWGLSFTDPKPAISPLHFCLPFAIVAMTTFVATALSYYGVARLTRELVGVLCPLTKTKDQPTRIKRKSRGNEVA
jgi:hypothetical protein